jgi:hypothetical protein
MMKWQEKTENSSKTNSRTLIGHVSKKKSLSLYGHLHGMKKELHFQTN